MQFHHLAAACLPATSTAQVQVAAQQGRGTVAYPPSPQQQLHFPSKLFLLLDEAERTGYSDVVSWLPHGRAFRVDDRDAFVERLMPAYFGQSSYSSLQRQLNIYGFTRIGSGPDKHGYYHQKFLRGMPFLVENFRRCKLKGQGPRKPAEIPPNFYIIMPWMPSTDSGGDPYQQGMVPRVSSTMPPTSLATLVVAPLLAAGQPPRNDGRPYSPLALADWNGPPPGAGALIHPVQMPQQDDPFDADHLFRMLNELEDD